MYSLIIDIFHFRMRIKINQEKNKSLTSFHSIKQKSIVPLHSIIDTMPERNYSNRLYWDCS